MSKSHQKIGDFWTYFCHLARIWYPFHALCQKHELFAVRAWVIVKILSYFPSEFLDLFSKLFQFGRIENNCDRIAWYYWQLVLFLLEFNSMKIYQVYENSIQRKYHSMNIQSTKMLATKIPFYENEILWKFKGMKFLATKLPWDESSGTKIQSM